MHPKYECLCINIAVEINSKMCCDGERNVKHEKNIIEFTPDKPVAQHPVLQHVSLFLTSLIKPARQQTAHLITVMSFHYCVAFMTVAVG